MRILRKARDEEKRALAGENYRHHVQLFSHVLVLYYIVHVHTCIKQFEQQYEH